MVVKPNDTSSAVLKKRQTFLDGLIGEIDENILNRSHETTDTCEIVIRDFYPHTEWVHNELFTQYKKAGWKYVTVFYRKYEGSTVGNNTLLYLSQSKKLFASFKRSYNGGPEYQINSTNLTYSISYRAGDAIEWELEQRTNWWLVAALLLGGIAVLKYCTGQ